MIFRALDLDLLFDSWRILNDVKEVLFKRWEENLSNDNDDGNDCLHLIITGNCDEFESAREVKKKLLKVM